MCIRSKAPERFSFLLSPGGIVIGYIVTLFAAVAGVGFFPFSMISIGLLFVVVGAFAVVAVPILVMVYLTFVVVICRAAMALGRRLFSGANSSQMTNKLFLFRKDVESQGTGAGLWDRWIEL
jgi:hypothetical protein